MVIISELLEPVVWLVWQACSDKAEFLFSQERLPFGGPLNAYQSDVWFVRVHSLFQRWNKQSRHVAPSLQDPLGFQTLEQIFSKSKDPVLSTFKPE